MELPSLHYFFVVQVVNYFKFATTSSREVECCQRLTGLYYRQVMEMVVRIQCLHVPHKYLIHVKFVCKYFMLEIFVL